MCKEIKIVKEKKQIREKKLCVGLYKETYDKLRNLSDDTGKSMTELAVEILEFGFNYINIVDDED